MIPLRDTIPSQNRPVMTWLLVLINILVFLYQLTLTPESSHGLNLEFGLTPVRYFNPDQSWFSKLIPFLSYLFLHEGWLHLIGNMWALWLFGDNVEDKMGAVRFLFFYLVMGIVAGGVHIFSDPGSAIPTIGASGAIAGVMGAYFLMYPTARIITLVPLFFIPLFIEIPALIYLAFWLLSQVYAVLIAHESGTVSSIAWSAHIGGFLAGIFGHRWFFRPYRIRYRL